jgi:signal transduction histidine kinase/Tfp pilus assembly protein PilF
MKIRLATFLFLFLPSITIAQKTDSLETMLRNAKDDSVKTILLSRLADELTSSNPERSLAQAREGLALAKAIRFEKGMFENYYSLGVSFRSQSLFDSSIIYLKHALRSAEIRRDVAGKAQVFSGLGHCFMRKSNFDSARIYLDRGLVLAKQITNYRIEAGIYNNYGNVYLEESNYQKALDYFVQAARLYEDPLHDDYGQCLALSNIGNIQYRLGNYDQALSYAQQSMVIAKRKSLISSIGYGHKLLGRIYRKQTKYDEALAEYKQGQKIYQTAGDKRSVAEILQNIGNIYFDKVQHQNALVNYLESLRLSKEISNKPLLAGSYSCVGQAYHVLKKYDAALHYLDSSCQQAQALGLRYLMVSNYEAMSSVYESTGDLKKALAMHRKFVELNDSVTRSENRSLTEEIQARYELEKKEAQIALLEKDKELKTLELGRHRAIQAGVATALVLVIVIAFLLVNRYRTINRVKRLTEIEEMRNVIARDLHDDIGSTLSTINLISKIAMKENARDVSAHLNRIAEQSSQMMENMSDIVWSINPINDSLQKVLVKMKVFTSEILEPKNISYRFQGEESLNGLSLDAEKRKNLFLIFKEAINNAAKYSGATEVEISLEQMEKTLRMKVADNGRGFDPGRVTSGNGLINMTERAKMLYAKFLLTSAQNQGTQIELVIPIT